jgi:hypothetical protein
MTAPAGGRRRSSSTSEDEGITQRCQMVEQSTLSGATASEWKACWSFILLSGMIERARPN